MKKIVALSHAGVIPVNREIYRYLAKALDAHLTLVVPQNWKGDLIRNLNTEKETENENFSVVPLPVLLSGHGSLFFYRNFDLRSSFDVLILDEEPWSLCAFQAYRALRDTPVKCFFTKQNIRKYLFPPFSWIEHRIYRESSAAFSISTEVEDVLRAKGFTQNIFSLPHSFDPNLFRPISKEVKKAKREELGIPTDAIVIVYAGRLTEEKGIHDLSFAMNSILAKSVKTKPYFLWIGNGPLYQTLESDLVKTNSQARLLHAVPHDKIGSYLALGDILVLPSRTRRNWKEQFGRILIEAMACGLAVIGSDSGEIPKVIKGTGSGLVFQEGQADHLQNQIENLLNYPEILIKLKDQAYRAVMEGYTHEAVARKWAQDLQLIWKNHRL